MVGVQDDRDAVCRCNGPDVVRSCNGTSDRSFLVLVVNALAGEVGRTALRDLQDEGALASRAASREATTVEELVTLMAGMAKVCS